MQVNKFYIKKKLTIPLMDNLNIIKNKIFLVSKDII